MHFRHCLHIANALRSNLRSRLANSALRNRTPNRGIMPAIVCISRVRKEPATRLSHLPALTAPVLRLNGLAPYYTMFPLAFPFAALASAKRSEWVFDPFCG